MRRRAGTTSTNSFQYTGRENDGTGLQYYRARYYSPRLQRFVGEDPLRLLAGDPNLYGYVFNNPILYRDPSGQIVPLIAGGIGAVAGIAGAVAQGQTSLAQIASSAVIGAGTGVAIAMLAPIEISSVLTGSLIGEVSNILNQKLTGRKPVNLGSVIGSTIAGGISGPLGDTITNVFVNALPNNPIAANALAGSLSGGISEGLNLVGQTIGQKLSPF